MSGILIIRTQGLGDIIHIIPSLRMIRKQLPTEKIAFLCRKGFGQILPKELNIKIFEMTHHAPFLEMLHLLKLIRKEHFDKVFDLFGNPRSAYICLFSGIKERYGFNYRLRTLAYTNTYTPPNPNKYLSLLFGDFFKYFGFKGEPDLTHLKMSEAEYKAAEASISHHFRKHPFLGINPNSTMQSRAWPREYFIKFINMWYEHTGSPVLITHGPGEIDFVNGLIKEVGEEKAFTNKDVPTNIFLALIGSLDLFFTADSGPMNIANAAGTPTIAMYGPTPVEPTAPRGEKNIILVNKELDCLVCHKDYCSDKKCMKSLTPELVFEKIKEKYHL